MTSTEIKIPVRARRRVEQHNPALVADLEQAIGERDWLGAFTLVPSEQCISLCKELWGIVPLSDHPAVLAQALAGGDLPAIEWAWLQKTLGQLHRLGRRVFDNKAAQEAFEALPGTVSVYRGTVEAEGNKYGICWTLNRERAIWFATKHGRFRNVRSRAVLLSALVPRESISGLLVERGEDEVLMSLWHLRNVSTEPLD